MTHSKYIELLVAAKNIQIQSDLFEFSVDSVTNCVDVALLGLLAKCDSAGRATEIVIR